jgi:membrane protease subunit (stomatin/prohibitin family)
LSCDKLPFKFGSESEQMALIDVVKWDNPGDLLAWKHPNSELSTATQLIVNESQEALFFVGGQRADTFTAGRHTLSTNNIPILGKLINLPFGGDSPFAAEVWFVNRTIALDIKWGTSTPIQLEDPQYSVVVPVRAFGQFGIQIEDAGKFVTKLVGAASSFDRATLQSHFQGILMARLKTAVASAIIKASIGVLEIATEVMNLSKLVEQEVTPEFAEYGVAFKSFRIISINVPEEDESYQMLKQAKANTARRKIEGISYQQERTFDVMETAAGNEGGATGAFIGAGMGIGMGMGVGAQAGQMMGQMNQSGAPAMPSAQPDTSFGSSSPSVHPEIDHLIVAALADGVITAKERAVLHKKALGLGLDTDELDMIVDARLHTMKESAAPVQMQFHIHFNGQKMGPYPLETLKQGIGSGQFTRETMVWRDGMSQWSAAGSVPELSSFFGPPPFSGGEPGGPPPFPGT